jgi:predicted AAA+ superfamily ATPase
MEIIDRFLHAPKTSFFLLGPRGTGKSTFVHQHFKNARKIHPADLRGLRSFKEEYPDSKALFLYRGKERLAKDGILCLPCVEFIKELRPDRLLDQAFN